MSALRTSFARLLTYMVLAGIFMLPIQAKKTMCTPDPIIGLWNVTFDLVNSTDPHVSNCTIYGIILFNSGGTISIYDDTALQASSVALPLPLGLRGTPESGLWKKNGKTSYQTLTSSIYREPMFKTSSNDKKLEFRLKSIAEVSIVDINSIPRLVGSIEQNIYALSDESMSGPVLGTNYFVISGSQISY